MPDEKSARLGGPRRADVPRLGTNEPQLLSIHPTAIISDEAEIAADATIGPFCVVTGKVRIGAGTVVEAHARIGSPFGEVTIGRENYIQGGAALGGPPQDWTYREAYTRLEIGDHNRIGENATIHLGTAKQEGVTRIGNHTYLMAYCHVAHDCSIGDRVIMANTATLAGHVDVGTGAIIGGLVGVHQFVRIGSYAIVGALSGIPLDIPPYVTAVVARGQKGRGLFGLNLIGLKRNRFPEETITELKKAYRILFRQGLPLREALVRAEEETASVPEVRHLLEFVRSSKRGVQR